MVLLRAALLELLVLYHVLGGAVLFRRLFPRESPWLAFVLPTLMVMCVCNFLEHFIAMPNLGWLLPVTLIGLGWAILRPGYVWKDLILPGAIFAATFTWVLFIRGLNPSITCNTEGVADMARVLDFCLGSRLPAIDTWCPPYDHGGYYTFQHYGASLLTRLFTLDVGTGYNIGFTLTNTFVMYVGAGAAYYVSGRRMLVCLATLLVLLANYKGASLVILVYNWLHPVPNLYDIFDSRLANDIGDGWNDPNRHNPFGWIFAHPPPTLRMFPPAYDIYFPEFHANIAGDFMTLASLFAASVIFSGERANWPWVCLFVFPVMTVIAATWFIIVVGVLCVGCLGVALLAGYRPHSWPLVAAGTLLGLLLIWPSVNTLMSGTYPVDIHFTKWVEYTNPAEFLIQWWPIIIPWLCLFFVWPRLSWLARWVHAAIPLLFIFFEVVSIADRGLTIEKNWGAIYSSGCAVLLPLVFVERNIVFRIVTVFYVFISLLFFAINAKVSYDGAWGPDNFRLQGDIIMQIDPQKKRIEQVLKRFHGVVVLPGKSVYSYNEAPSIVGFSENMCYIAWFYQEDQCGHGGEAQFRDKETNAFYAGAIADPLGFLRSNNITAVMIYPEDKIPDDALQKITSEISPDYYYIDCKGADPGYPSNAGVFVKKG